MIPSRNRPGELLQAVESVRRTSKAWTAAYIDDDQYDLYRDVIDALGTDRFLAHIGTRRTPVAAANYMVMHNDGYQAYGLITDDSRMTIEGWDDWLESIMAQFPNRVGVASPYHNQGNHVDMPFVSREWINATGWFAYPRAFHYCWPIITGLIGEMSAIVHAPRDRFAVHHPHKTELVSVEGRQHDAQAFFEFVSLELPAVVERVRTAMQPAMSETEQWP